MMRLIICIGRFGMELVLVANDDLVIWVRWIDSEFAGRKIAREVKKRLLDGRLADGVEARVATGKVLIRLKPLKLMIQDMLKTDPGFNLSLDRAIENGLDLKHPLNEYLTPNEWADRKGVSRQWIHQMVRRHGVDAIKWESPKQGSDHFTLYHVPAE